MKLFFPEPRDDETLYSVIARIQALTGFSTKLIRKTYPFLRVSPAGYKNLARLAEVLPANSSLRGEDILLKRTTFGAMSFGMSRQETDKLRTAMWVPNTLRTQSRLLSPWTYLKSCPLCVKADESRYGEAHWRRSHQPRTVTACTLHGCRLLRVQALRREPLRTPSADGLVIEATQVEITHASTVRAILDGLRVDSAVLLQLVKQRLVEIGHAREGVKSILLAKSSLIDWMRNQPTEFLDELDLKARKRRPLRPAWFKSKAHPTKRLSFLLIARLCAEDLRRPPRPPKRFPCGNSLSNCCLKRTAVLVSSIGGRALIRCQVCDYEYNAYAGRIMASTSPETVKRDVRRPGKVWEEEFAKLWGNPEITKQELVARSGVGPHRAQHFGAKLGLPPKAYVWWFPKRKRRRSSTTSNEMVEVSGQKRLTESSTNRM